MHPYATLAVESAVETAAGRRERLIIEHLPQVRLIARRLRERLPDHVSLDDLVSAGTLGLISAIDSFDETHQVKLKTYAEYKIRGAILDSLRSLDWASRHRRKKAKDIEAAISKAEQRLKRIPTEEDVAEELEIPLAEYQSRLTDVQGLNLESLEVPIGPGETRTLLSMVPADESKQPSQQQLLERSELERLLAAAIEQIPDLERKVLALYFHEELTLREIADVLHLHISRVAELKSHSILRLRAALRKQWPTTRGR